MVLQKKFFRNYQFYKIDLAKNEKMSNDYDNFL